MSFDTGDYSRDIPEGVCAEAIAGRYAIERVLGRGGMATVMLAKDLAHDRYVAVKLLRPELAGAVSHERFLREMRITARLQHPNIVPLFDSGVIEGTPYYIMPYIEGESLRARLVGGSRLSVPEALRIATDVADALAYAHSRGIVHRDIKPENVLLTGDRAVVSDFGIARALAQSDDDQITSSGFVIGTPAYMSPEQSRGDRRLDARTDIYSLGRVLLEMLTGDLPVHYELPVRDDLLPVAPILEPHFGTLGDVVPESVRITLRSALAVVPDARFDSAEDFRAALTGVPAAPTAPTSHQARLPTMRTAVMLVFIAAGAVVVSVAATRHGWTHRAVAARHPRLAVLPFQSIGDTTDKYFADDMSDAVRAKLTTLNDLDVIGLTSSSLYTGTTKTPQQIGRELGVQYILIGKVRWARSLGGTSRVEVTPQLIEVATAVDRWEQSFDAEIADVFQVQADIASQVVLQLQITLTSTAQGELRGQPTHDLAAYRAFLRGRAIERHGTSATNERLAVVAYREAVRRDSGFALAWAALSDAYSLVYVNGEREVDDAHSAEMAVSRALALGPSLPEVHAAQGLFDSYVRQDQHRALAEFQEGLALSPSSAQILRRIGEMQANLGRWDSATTYVERAAQLDPRNARIFRSLGFDNLFLRRYPESHRAFDRALALEPSDLSIVDERTLVFLAEGDLFGARSNVQAALALIDSAAVIANLAEYWDLVWVLDSGQREMLVSLRPSAFGDSRFGWAISLTEAYALRGDTRLARVYADSARLATEADLAVNPNNAHLRVFHALALAYLGRAEDADREGERGVALLPISVDADAGAYLQHQLARIYVLNGEADKAIRTIGSLLKIPYPISPSWLAIDPYFAPLRRDPRFLRLTSGA